MKAGRHAGSARIASSPTTSKHRPLQSGAAVRKPLRTADPSFSPVAELKGDHLQQAASGLGVPGPRRQLVRRMQILCTAVSNSQYMISCRVPSMHGVGQALSLRSI
mmetsp:Transcript_108829/g.281310  ORF Transcript_108829/g.281310 Transcript_108829/m.281310 type:complete len:106 (+) Transcript_108829:363-680(+)